ncbi:protein translocase subunit SecD [Sansalvadorimonas sp. 2012CJ34-2]|uniref:Protein translocase subunit SecD n=1 Tax=Parendozoicomonas callyspongiae TaxID=2942213 RepID=A0ABT0PCC6_9GAMM|nr:protein translocase subunit SecD [Sansalvadorimonas sp. 2012CJ34-2]MCL6269037.1 protein translocase subunit SecD [Sansalvadorimonas sp. 2012CJ34-2]
MNRYPLWKYLSILLFVAVGVFYALPNLYPDDPAVQISGASSSLTLNESEAAIAVKVLEKAGIAVKSTEVSPRGDSVLIRLTDSEDQLPAKAAISERLGHDYVVALNLAPTTPEWLTSMGAYPMKLGLDLSGGVHFLLEVDTPRAVQTRMDVYAGEIRTALRKERLRYRTVPEKKGSLARELAFNDAATRDSARKVISKEFPDLQTDTSESNGRFLVKYNLTEQQIRDLEDYAVKQNLTTVRNRVNELGVSEPLVQRQGRKNIVVELPGVQDTAEAKRILGKTANLEFRLAANYDAAAGTYETFEFRSDTRRTANLERDIILTGDQVSNARSNVDTQTGGPQVNIDLDNRGGQLINRATRNNVGRSMAVLFIEQRFMGNRTEKRVVDGEEIEVQVPIYKQEKGIISLATIQSVLGNSFRITGLDSRAEASELALLLRAGSLAAPMHFVEERTVGPSLGKENIRMGINSTMVGLALIILFMLVVYRFFGLVANVALALNLVLLVGMMSILGATLTMPGIAGIVLTLGMAVDANVLVFSRIREELKRGLTPHKAIAEGFDRAFVSIFDANITTLIVGVILYAIGTGPVKGFAVTLSLGILTSMFTAILVSRAIVNMTYGRRRQLKKISI